MKTIFITIALLFTTLTVVMANPNSKDAEIRKQIETMYKNAVILEIEYENGNIEVEIIHNQKEKDVTFNNAGEWQSTKYDILKLELPDKIKTVIKNSKYSSYNIDDIEAIETPSKSIYEIELDKLLSDDVTIYITFEGVIL